MESEPLSNIKSFLVFQMTKQAVIIISLKISLPNCCLATNSMSRGWRLRFQTIGMEFQQLCRKGTQRTGDLLIYLELPKNVKNLKYLLIYLVVFVHTVLH